MNNSFVDGTQWAQLRHDMMNSLRDELRGEFQSRIDQLEEECQMLRQTNSQLKQRCDDLQHTNQTMFQIQLDKISRLEGEVKSLQMSRDRANRKAKYQEILLKNLKWEYPLEIPTHDELLSLGYDQDESNEIHEDIDDLMNITTGMRMGQCMRTVRVHHNPNNLP